MLDVAEAVGIHNPVPRHIGGSAIQINSQIADTAPVIADAVKPVATINGVVALLGDKAVVLSATGHHVGLIGPADLKAGAGCDGDGVGATGAIAGRAGGQVHSDGRTVAIKGQTGKSTGQVVSVVARAGEYADELIARRRDVEGVVAVCTRDRQTICAHHIVNVQQCVCAAKGLHNRSRSRTAINGDSHADVHKGQVVEEGVIQRAVGKAGEAGKINGVAASRANNNIRFTVLTATGVDGVVAAAAHKDFAGATDAVKGHGLRDLRQQVERAGRVVLAKQLGGINRAVQVRIDGDGAARVDQRSKARRVIILQLVQSGAKGDKIPVQASHAAHRSAIVQHRKTGDGAANDLFVAGRTNQLQVCAGDNGGQPGERVEQRDLAGAAGYHIQPFGRAVSIKQRGREKGCNRARKGNRRHMLVLRVS
mmetsp:Transcript_23216/g.39852  ORF Transcript_23216/g.39852 Transcript_23216/m.39852 type:complete len:423 (-) Transcript_23216:311-1579(-)